MTGPRDWDKEMAEIDKLLVKGGTPSGTSSTPVRVGSPKSPPSVAQSDKSIVTRGHHIAGVWARALLGIAGAAALPFWPYAKSCGTMLYTYLLATLAVALVGIWTMQYAWTHRRGFAHVAGLLALLAGLGFGAMEILQRTSLVAARLTWTCP